MSDQVSQLTDIVCTTEAKFLEEGCYFSNDDEDVMSCLPVCEAKEDSKPKLDEIQVIELEVERFM